MVYFEDNLHKLNIQQWFKFGKRSKIIKAAKHLGEKSAKTATGFHVCSNVVVTETMETNITVKNNKQYPGKISVKFCFL